MSRRKNNKLWEYLEASGVLQNGTEQEIALVRKEYKKKYIKSYMRQKRNASPEFVIDLSKKNGEYATVATAAKRHRKTITAFLKLSALAYLRQTYVVQDRERINNLELLLSECLNEIREITNSKDRLRFVWDSKIDIIEKRIEKLERELIRVLEHPQPLESVIKEAIQKDPSLKELLTQLISSL